MKRKIALQYHGRIGDAVALFPAALALSKNYEVLLEIDKAYHEIFDCVDYVRPVEIGKIPNGAEVVGDLTIYPKLFDDWIRSKKTWVEYVYSKHPSMKMIAPHAKFPPYLNSIPSIDIRSEYGLQKPFALVSPFGYSQPAKIPAPWTIQKARELWPDLPLYVLAPPNAPELPPYAQYPLIAVKHLSHLPVIIREAKELLTINTSSSIIASAVRDSYYHVVDPISGDYFSPRQKRIYCPMFPEKKSPVDDVIYVTIGTGSEYYELAENFAKLFERMNGKKVIVITDNDVRQVLPGIITASPHWTKAYLWDLLPPGTKRFCYMDADMLPVKPLGDLPDGAFCAVPEPGGVEWEKKNGFEKVVRGIKSYFNSGLMVCDRRSTPVFEAMKLHNFLRQDMSVMKDQTWFNHFVQIILGGYTPLPATWNWYLYDNEVPKNTDAKMFHFIMDPQKKKAMSMQREKLTQASGEQIRDAIMTHCRESAKQTQELLDKQKLKICVYAISKNEEKFVERFMKSCEGAEGVYVIDTGSTDETVSKLAALGAHVEMRHYEKFRFDEARNDSLTLVPEDADVCVCIDLDEVLCDGWRKIVEGAWVPGTTRLLYQYAWSPDKIFPYAKIHARHGYQWLFHGHEDLFALASMTESRRQVPDVLVQHFPDQSKPRSQYLSLLEEAAREFGAFYPQCLFYLCREYLFHAKWKECLSTAKVFLDLTADYGWGLQRAMTSIYAARSSFAQRDIPGAEKWHLLACSEAAHQREPWLALGEFYKLQHNWSGVLAAAERALQCATSEQSYLNEPAAWSHEAHELAAIGAFRLAMYNLAYKRISEAVRLAPEIARLHQFNEKCRVAASGPKHIRTSRIHLLWPTARAERFASSVKVWMDRAKGSDFYIYACMPEKEFRVVSVPEAGVKLKSVLIDKGRGGVAAAAFQLSSEVAASPEFHDDDIVVLASDDFEPPEGWDVEICDWMTGHDGALIVNNGKPPYCGNVVDLPIMTVGCLRRLNGIIYHPAYYHNYSDQELWDVLHEMKLVKNIRTTATPAFQHHHWRTNHRERDEVDARSQAHAEEDKATYEKRRFMTLSQKLKI